MSIKWLTFSFNLLNHIRFSLSNCFQCTCSSFNCGWGEKESKTSKRSQNSKEWINPRFGSEKETKIQNRGLKKLAPELLKKKKIVFYLRARSKKKYFLKPGVYSVFCLKWCWFKSTKLTCSLWKQGSKKEMRKSKNLRDFNVVHVASC